MNEVTDEEFRSRQLQRYLRALIDVQLETSESEESSTDGESKAKEEVTPAEDVKLSEEAQPVEVSKPAEVTPSEVKSVEEAKPTEEVTVPTEAVDSNVAEAETTPSTDVVEAKAEEKPAEKTAAPVTDAAEDKSEAKNEDEPSEEDLANRPRPRIIYLKDFGGIASHSQPLIKELILAVRAHRVALQAGGDSTDPYKASKIQPTVIVLGVSYSPENSPHNCCSSCTWTRFMEGFESSDADKLCQLLPDILAPTVSKSSADDMAKVIADALFTSPKRVSYSDRTYVDPDVGSGAVYRQIICAYGFSDSRDPLVKPKKGDKGEKGVKKPDENIWRRGTSAAQKERKEEFGVMRLTRNEHIVRKALSALGGRVTDGVGMFSALPEEDKADEEDEKKAAKGKGKATDPTKKDKKDKSKKKKKTKEELEAEKYTTIAGLKDNLLSRTVADRIAAIALHGLPTSGSVTPKPKALVPQALSITTTATIAAAAVKSASPNKAERIVSPEELAAAIKASLIGNDRRKEWLENYEKLKNAGDASEPNANDDADEEEKKEDPILAKVRASGTLNSHEERLIGGVIDTSKFTQ